MVDGPGMEAAVSRLPRKKRILKVVTTTQNDWPTLQWWVWYHGDMLGFENLYILGSSTDERCIDFLKMVQQFWKVNVIFIDFDNSSIDIRPFFDMMMDDIFEQVTNATDIVVILPLDADEFLGVIPHP